MIHDWCYPNVIQISRKKGRRLPPFMKIFSFLYHRQDSNRTWWVTRWASYKKRELLLLCEHLILPPAPGDPILCLFMCLCGSSFYLIFLCYVFCFVLFVLVLCLVSNVACVSILCILHCHVVLCLVSNVACVSVLDFSNTYLTHTSRKKTKQYWCYPNVIQTSCTKWRNACCYSRLIQTTKRGRGMIHVTSMWYKHPTRRDCCSQFLILKQPMNNTGTQQTIYNM